MPSVIRGFRIHVSMTPNSVIRLVTDYFHGFDMKTRVETAEPLSYLTEAEANV